MRKNKLWIMLLLLAALMLAACRGGNGGDGTPEGTQWHICKFSSLFTTSALFPFRRRP